MSWTETIKAQPKRANWVGYCPACEKWRAEHMAKKQGNKWFCTRFTNYRGYKGDAEMYVRENLERFDKLGWDRRIKGCGMELLPDDSRMGSLITYRDYTDFRQGGY